MPAGHISSQKCYFQFPQPIALGPPLQSYPYAGTYINAVVNRSFVSNWLSSLGIPNPGFTALIIGLDSEIWATQRRIPASGLPTDVFNTWFTMIYLGKPGSAVSAGNMPGVTP